MSLTPGTRLGPYEISAQIGVGGMGEVYQATDTQLKRQVAIKVLPEAVAADAERLARFQREAEVLASLNHPNIAGIHGLEKSGGTTALILELVAGPTLAERIAEGPISIDEALPIVKQIAAALEAAHEQGIIHRDLKPSNIKLRPDGTVKVLDFGLAKAMEPTGAMSPSHSLSPTITTPAMTQLGMILGTAAYMSPEQAKGRPADKRSDVWAFGCVLFETLTGRQSFEGEDISETLASVLKTEPDWAALPADVSPAIRTLLRRCLTKDRRQRISDMSVASFVLAEAATLPMLSGVRPADGPVPHTSRWRSAAVAASVIGAASLVGLGAWISWPSAEQPVARFSFRLPDGQRFTNAGRRVVSISPDGSQVAYVANNRIYLRSVSEFESHVVPGSEIREGVLNPVFSPDSGSLAFFSNADQTLRRVALTGGAPVRICEAEFPTGMTWDASGIVFGQGAGGIRRCPADGGMPEQLAKVETDEQASGPQVLPGGEFLIFSIAREQDGLERHDKARIVVQSLATGERRTLIEGGSEARYLPTGHLLYALGGSLFAVSFDPARQMVTGGPMSVVEGVRRDVATAVAHFDTSDSGNLLYVPGPARLQTAEYTVAYADRSGSVTPLKASPGPYARVRASRDGTRVAVDTDDGKDAIVWIYELAEVSAMKRLTFGGGNRLPIWSPDSQRVAFQSDREGDLAIFAQRIDGTGLERLTRPEKGEAHVPESWSPDGRHISYSVLKESEYSLWVLSVGDGETTRFSDVRSVEPIGSEFSPDGKWIAYHALPPGSSAVSPSSGVFVEPFPARPGVKHQAPKMNRDFQTLWSRDGTELFYVASGLSGGLTAVPVKTTSGVTFGSPHSFPFIANAGRLSGTSRAFDALPDGRFIGLVVGSGDKLSGVVPSPEIRVVLNWFAELKQLASTK